MNASPLVSILIPTYNREKFISRAIEVSCSQTYHNIEVVVIDNCSTDSSWEIICQWAKKDSRVKAYRNKENIGPVRNWEKCISHAQGEYSKILWSDDSISNSFIEKTLNLFDSSTAFAISNFQVVNEVGKIRLKVALDAEYSKEAFLKTHLLNKRFDFPVSPGCAIFRTKDIKEALLITVPNTDGLDSSKNGAGNDLLIFLQIANKYSKIKVLQEFAASFTSHPDSFTAQSNLELYYSWAKLYFIKKNNLTSYYSTYKKQYTIKALINKDIRYNNIRKDVPWTFSYPFALCIAFLRMATIKLKLMLKK